MRCEALILVAAACALISSWGPATSTYAEPNGNTLYEWDNVEGAHVVNPVWASQAKAAGGDYCLTRMTAAPTHKLVGWTWDGPDCR